MGVVVTFSDVFAHGVRAVSVRTSTGAARGGCDSSAGERRAPNSPAQFLRTVHKCTYRARLYQIDIAEFIR